MNPKLNIFYFIFTELEIVRTSGKEMQLTIDWNHQCI